MKTTVNRINIIVYDNELKAKWDEFVVNSRNGTFLLCRDYMDYHAERYADHSLMFYKDDRLFAVLPGNISEGTFHSHAGLTYGGFVMSERATAALMLEAFHALLLHLRALGGISRMIYRPIPYIYQRYPSEEDLYALFRLGAQVVERKISSVIPQHAPYGFSTLRTRKWKKASGLGLTISQDDDFGLFWPVLETTLQERHEARPVHSLQEITHLQKLFPENILLYRVLDHDRTIAGCVLYITEKVAHVQYIASSPDGREVGALEWLFRHLIYERHTDRSYFDFGTSVEQGGLLLNEGLIFQKEGFGGRGVVYDGYELKL